MLTAQALEERVAPVEALATSTKALAESNDPDFGEGLFVADHLGALQRYRADQSRDLRLLTGSPRRDPV